VCFAYGRGPQSGGLSEVYRALTYGTSFKRASSFDPLQEGRSRFAAEGAVLKAGSFATVRHLAVAARQAGQRQPIGLITPSKYSLP